MYSLRSIAFLAEVLFLPRSHPAEGLQRLHGKAFTKAECGYANFALIQGGAQLTNPVSTQGAVSSAAVMPDRLRLQEHLTGIASEDFERRVVEFARIALEELTVPAFVAQQFVVQSLVNPRFPGTANEFMARRVLNQPEDVLNSLPRQPRLIGVRMTFPSEQPGQPLFNLRIESYQKDPRSVFIENTGVFQAPVNLENVEQLHSLFAQTYVFVERSVVDLLARLDGNSREP